jgi:tRNA(fMet)-specific endonuclease VapC
MILLDTDILSLYHAGHERVIERVQNLDPGEVIGTTIITRAEILRARLDALLKAADGEQLQRAQERLAASESLLNSLHIVQFDAASTKTFEKLRLRKKLKKIGYADLLIASIALTNDAILVTRNVKHFRQVPNLSVENWAD